MEARVLNAARAVAICGVLIIAGAESPLLQEQTRPLEKLVAEFEALEIRKINTAAGSEARAVAAREQATLATRIAWGLYSDNKPAEAGNWFARHGALQREGATIWLALLAADLARLDASSALLKRGPALPPAWKAAQLAALETTARALRALGLDSSDEEKAAEAVKAETTAFSVERQSAVLEIVDEGISTNLEATRRLARAAGDMNRQVAAVTESVKRERAQLDAAVHALPAGSQEVSTAKAELADALRTLAVLDTSTARYASAEQHYLEALEIEKTVPPDFAERRIAETLSGLGSLFLFIPAR